MPERPLSELEASSDPVDQAVLRERRRCLRIIEAHQHDMGQLWPRLWNLISMGRDFDDPDDMVDRLPGM